MKLRYRNGYTAAEAGAASAPARAELQEALTTPIAQNAMLLTARLLPAGGQFKFALQIEPRQQMRSGSGGQWTGALDLLPYQCTPVGKMKGHSNNGATGSLDLPLVGN